MEKLQDALVAIDTGNIEKGLRLLEKMEKKADDETKFLLAETYYELGHIDKAKKIIDELLLAFPGDGELLTFKAELLIDLDEEDEAIALLTEITEEDPAFLQAQLLLADLFQLQGFDEVAEQKLLKASQFAPDEPIIMYGLGDFYLTRGDYQKSIPLFKRVYHEDKDQRFKGEIELKMAEAYSGIGEFEEALNFYEQGLKEKTELEALFGYGYTAFQLEKHELAINQLKKLKELDPHFTSLYPYLAKAYEALEMLEEALATLKEGLAVDEFNEAMYVHAAKLCFKLQDQKNGEKYLQQIIAINPANFEAVSTYAAYLKHEERFSDLLDLIKTYEETGEDDPLLTWYAAVSYQQEDMFTEANKCFNDVYHYFSDDADFLEDYSLFLLENGNREEALEIMKKVIKMDQTKHHIIELIDHLEQEEIF